MSVVSGGMDAAPARLDALFCSLIPSWSCCWKPPGPPRSETCSGPLQFSMKMNLRLLFLPGSLTLPAHSQCSSKAAAVPWVRVWDSCLEQQLEQGLVHEAVPVPQPCQPCALGAEWRPEKHQWREKAKSQKRHKKLKRRKNFFRPVKIFVKISVGQVPCSLIFLCAAAWASLFTFVFVLWVTWIVCDLKYLLVYSVKAVCFLNIFMLIIQLHGISVGFFLSLGFPHETLTTVFVLAKYSRLRMVHKVVFYWSFLVLFSFSWCQPLLERLYSGGKLCIFSGCLLLLHTGGLFLMGPLGADVVAIIISKILNGMWALSFWSQIFSLENLQVIIICPPYKGKNLFGKLHKTCYASSLLLASV